jgi:hypothetical protein
MKRRTITTIGIVSAILMTVSGAELAFARGGGGSCNGKGSGANAGASMSQKGETHQYQNKQQNQYRYRQENGVSDARSVNGQKQGDQLQSKSREQLRDPATHVIEIPE